MATWENWGTPKGYVLFLRCPVKNVLTRVYLHISKILYLHIMIPRLIYVSTYMYIYIYLVVPSHPLSFFVLFGEPTKSCSLLAGDLRTDSPVGVARCQVLVHNASVRRILVKRLGSV